MMFAWCYVNLNQVVNILNICRVDCVMFMGGHSIKCDLVTVSDIIYVKVCGVLFHLVGTIQSMSSAIIFSGDSLSIRVLRIGSFVCFYA